MLLINLLLIDMLLTLTNTVVQLGHVYSPASSDSVAYLVFARSAMLKNSSEMSDKKQDIISRDIRVTLAAC